MYHSAKQMSFVRNCLWFFSPSARFLLTNSLSYHNFLLLLMVVYCQILFIQDISDIVSLL